MGDSLPRCHHHGPQRGSDAPRGRRHRQEGTSAQGLSVSGVAQVEKKPLMQLRKQFYLPRQELEKDRNL